MAKIVAVGAEMQAASSLALAYPEREILFISDQPVLDGWDIPNVRYLHSTPNDWRRLVANDDTIVLLCPRWQPKEEWSLAQVLPPAARALGTDLVLPVQDRPGPQGNWQVKGNRWHRPDAPMAGPAGDLVEVMDTHGCELVYQPLVRAVGTVMAIGRRMEGAVALGLFRVFDERFFRIAILQAAESIADKRIAGLSLEVLETLGYSGFFTLNWLLTRDGPRLTSFRPVPRAAFGAFRRGGIDVLAPPGGIAELPADLRFVAQPHYLSYSRLEA